VTDKGRTIRVPRHVHQKSFRIARDRAGMSKELGREPSEEEVAKRLSLTTKEIRRTEEMMQDISSLNKPLPTADDGAVGLTTSELGDLVEDEHAAEAPDVVLREIETAHLKGAIEGLQERARYVLVRRYGLDDREPATLAELGEDLGISRERVRQLQRDAELELRLVCDEFDRTSGAA
jgi:RNA polymerase primary sigma factor